MKSLNARVRGFNLKLRLYEGVYFTKSCCQQASITIHKINVAKLTSPLLGITLFFKLAALHLSAKLLYRSEIYLLIAPHGEMRLEVGLFHKCQN